MKKGVREKINRGRKGEKYLSVLLETHLGSQSSSRVGACTCHFLTTCSSSVTLADVWIKGSVAFH